jgi:signal recognition particle GTPase
MSDVTTKPEARRSGLFSKVKRGLFMTHTEILEKLGTAVKKGLGIDESVLASLEEALIEADVGAETADALTAAVRARTGAAERGDLADLRRYLIEEIEKLIAGGPVPRPAPAAPLEVIFLVGVNGSQDHDSGQARRAAARGRPVRRPRRGRHVSRRGDRAARDLGRTPEGAGRASW